MKIIIDVSLLFSSTGKAILSNLSDYERQVADDAGQGNEIILTGSAPIWLYLKLAHALHGKARKLYYDSPVTGPILIFDHDPA